MSDRQTGDHPHLRLVRDYLRAIEQEADDARLAAFFTPDIQQREYPNRLVARGAVRNLNELLAGSRKGRAVVQNQRYVVESALVQDDRVAIEVMWSAQLRVALGSLAPGDTMSARSAMFFRIRDGRLAEQHNFDCFEPF
jgi:ketosteroid isomerase-like protein